MNEDVITPSPEQYTIQKTIYRNSNNIHNDLKDMCVHSKKGFFYELIREESIFMGIMCLS